jgi:hypothetical protein
MVHLAWCRVHNGEFQPPRRSDEGVRLPSSLTPDSAMPELRFLGRHADSLTFEVPGAAVSEGFTVPPNPGFRYDLADDTASVLPQSALPAPDVDLGGLPAYPFFAYFAPGAPLMPKTLFSPATAVAGWLRSHCRFEAALKWYALVHNPLGANSAWCPGAHQGELDIFRDDGAEERECCSGHVFAAMARTRSIVLYHLETMLQWAGAVMRRNSPEAFQQARLMLDTAARILGPSPRTVIATDPGTDPPTVAGFDPDDAPLNPRLLALYERVQDDLALIHACLNARRLRIGRPNTDMPYWGDSPLRDGWQTTADICQDEEDWCTPHWCYRFSFLIQKAQELAGEVRALGAALQAAYEKGDAEYLAALRATQERQLLNLALEIRQNQWRESDWQVQALGKTRAIAETRRRYYQQLIEIALIAGELDYEAQSDLSLSFQEAGRVSEAIAEGVSWIPDINLGTVGPCPAILNHLPLGTKLGNIFVIAARILNSLASSATTRGSLSLTQAGWIRREDEWNHQVAILEIEIEQIERQILAAERRRDIALRELNNHQRQMENAAEIQGFLRDKFTSHALFLWLQQETAALHQQMYELAFHTARQAQHAFNYERGHLARKFLPSDGWDSLHEGLLAGERLQLALRQMEKAYLDENCREYELTKHLSLRLHFPMEFLRLRVTGMCEIEIPEWMFDLDYPGHYLRRIKNVTVTIPAVVGPYTGVHCRLTLLSSRTRVDPHLRERAAACCADQVMDDGYQALPEDPRIVRQYAATEAIATSSGQNDSGMFELNFRDERYLPFEFAGAVSRWRIELPEANNFFDLQTLSDLIVHLNYTAREGGDVLRTVADEAAQQHLPGSGWRFFEVENELPDQWRPVSAARPSSQQLQLRLDRSMFPFLPGRRDVWITRIEILLEIHKAEPCARLAVEFTGPQEGNDDDADCHRGIVMVDCVASAEWPGLYHGVLEVPLGRLRWHGQRGLRIFRIAECVGRVAHTYLFCRYEAR